MAEDPLAIWSHDLAEKRVGLIPYAVANLRLPDEHCALFVTDQRTILVFARPRALPKGDWKRMVGIERDRPVTRPPQIDFQRIEIDSLAAMNDNYSVAHSSVERFICGKRLGRYGFWPTLRDGYGDRLTYSIVFIPHPERMRELRREGRTRNEIRKEYADKCQEVFRKALPVAMANEGDWRS